MGWESRTVIEFKVESADETWDIILQWAKESSFRVKKSIPTGKLFQKGFGFLLNPMMLGITIEGGQLHLEAWVRLINPIGRFVFRQLSTPPEMGIHLNFPQAGFAALTSRKIACNAVNKLLKRLNQPVIEMRYGAPTL